MKTQSRWHRRARHALSHSLRLRLMTLFLLLALAMSAGSAAELERKFPAIPAAELNARTAGETIAPTFNLCRCATFRSLTFQRPSGSRTIRRNRS